MKRQMSMDRNRKLLLQTGFAGIFCVVCILLFSLRVFAASGVVTTDNVNIRSKASATSEPVGAADENDKVTIVSEETGSDGKTWYKIKTADGITGYIRSDFIKKDAEETQADNTKNEETTNVTAVTEKKAYVKGTTGVNIRKSASVNGTKVATAMGGSEVTVIGEATGADGKLWYQIQFAGDGTTMKGFVRSDLLDFNKPQQEAEVVEIGGEADTNSETEVEDESSEMPSEEPLPNDDAQKTEVTASTSELMVLEPESMLENIPAGFEQTNIMFGENAVTAWTKGDFYIFYASKSGGAPEWYLYDRSVKGYVKYMGLFPSQNITVMEEPAVFNWLSGVLLVIILILVVLLAVVGILYFKNSGSVFADDRDDDYENDDDEDEDEEDVKVDVTKHEMNYINQRPMENKTIEPKTLIMPSPVTAYEDDDDDEEELLEEEIEQEEDSDRKKTKKKKFGQKLLDYFTTEVEDDDEEDEEDEEDGVYVSEDDEDDDLNFIDL